MLEMKAHTKNLIWEGHRLTPQMREEIDALPELTVNELRGKFSEVLGYATHSRNRQFLIRKITWGIQARQWGDISPQTRKRAHDLADFRFLRLRMPKGYEAPAPEQGDTVRKKVSMSRDTRLPMPGAMLVKDHEGKRIDVKVLDDAFEYEGRRYRSLSAIAREVTGTNWNGFKFFGLGDAT